MIDSSFYFKNKFRIPSSRLKNWDYSSTGWYFVTVCIKDRRCILGEIKDKKIILSKYGKIVKTEWLKTKQIRKNIDLDEYIIMPNHLHGIIIIKYPVETSRRDVSTIFTASYSDWRFPSSKLYFRFDLVLRIAYCMK